jgi:hypothetical protein
MGCAVRDERRLTGNQCKEMEVDEWIDDKNVANPTATEAVATLIAYLSYE